MLTTRFPPTTPASIIIVAITTIIIVVIVATAIVVVVDNCGERERPTFVFASRSIILMRRSFVTSLVLKDIALPVAVYRADVVTLG